MAGFGHNRHFRLEQVLEYRRRLTESAQQMLAERTRERTALEASLAQVERERAALASYLEQALDGDAVDLAALAVAEAYDDSLRTTAMRQAQAKLDALAREEEALSQLLDRRRSQRVLEKLRERAIREAEERHQAAEARLLDEVATVQRAHSPAAGSGGGGYGR